MELLIELDGVLYFLTSCQATILPKNRGTLQSFYTSLGASVYFALNGGNLFISFLDVHSHSSPVFVNTFPFENHAELKPIVIWSFVLFFQYTNLNRFFFKLTYFYLTFNDHRRHTNLSPQLCIENTQNFRVNNNFECIFQYYIWKYMVIFSILQH